MRALSEVENLSLAAILKMESDGLVMQRAISSLISDEDLKRQSEASILATEGRIKGIQQLRSTYSNTWRWNFNPSKRRCPKTSKNKIKHIVSTAV